MKQDLDFIVKKHSMPLDPRKELEVATTHNKSIYFNIGFLKFKFRGK